jgi:hypothetical protein
MARDHFFDYAREVRGRTLGADASDADAGSFAEKE